MGGYSAGIMYHSAAPKMEICIKVKLNKQPVSLILDIQSS